MKILIDQNISHRIVSFLIPFFEVVNHVKDLGLTNANDYDIFMYARENDFQAIITIDEDFIKLLDIFSHPPKVIWIRTGNCSTIFLSNLFQSKSSKIEQFLSDLEFSIYEIFRD